MGDAHPVAKGERREVRIGDARHDGELDGLTVVTAGGRGGEGGGTDGAILAPEIELIGGIQSGGELVVDESAWAADIDLPLARAVGGGIERGDERCGADAHLRIRFAHSRDRGSKVIVGRPPR